jgi:hypothetical protein
MQGKTAKFRNQANTFIIVETESLTIENLPEKGTTKSVQASANKWKEQELTLI